MRKYKWLLLIVLIICLTLTALGGLRSKEDQYIHVGIAVYEALNVQKKNGTVLSVFRITISNEGGYKLFYVEEVSGASYNGETYPNEVLKFSDTKYGNVYSDVTFEFVCFINFNGSLSCSLISFMKKE